MKEKRKRLKQFAPLKPGTNTIDLVAFDTEDNGQGAPYNFICASFYSKNFSKTIFNKEVARQTLFTHSYPPKVFFAHNLSYDISNLDYPEGTANLISIDSRLIGATYKYGNRKHAFMDTGNFFVGASIEKLGETLGYPKLSFDINRIKNKKYEDLDEATKKDVDIYCMRDAEICYKIATKLYELTCANNTKFKAFTAASLAMRIFRTNYLDRVWFCRKHLINDIERLGYYGGRTEVFDYRFYQETDHEDIRSSYPRAMKYEIYPIPDKYKVIEDPTLNTILYQEGVSMVRVEVPKMRIPPLPCRREDGRLLFPWGEWTGVYCHNELRMAVKYGVKIKKVYQSIVYNGSFRPFIKYVDTFYEKKNTTTGIDREFYKLMLNGLSGKFGEKRNSILRMRIDKLELCSCNPPDANLFNHCRKCKRLIIEGTTPLAPNRHGWISVIGTRLPDPKHTFPIIIAYVTAYGRIQLYEERLSKCAALYCDTDSCIAPKTPGNNIGPGLGQWECDKYFNFIAFAPKYYKFTVDSKTGKADKMKLKGVPTKHRTAYVCPQCNTKNTDKKCSICSKILTDDDFRYIFDKPLKLAEAIKRDLAPNEWREVKKRVRMIDDKRIKLPNGDSEPLHVFMPDNYKKFEDFLNIPGIADVEHDPEIQDWTPFSEVK